MKYLTKEEQQALLSGPLLSNLSEYLRNHPLFKTVELEFFKLNDSKVDALKKSYIERYGLYDETVKILKDSHNIELLICYYKKNLSRDDIERQIRKIVACSDGYGHKYHAQREISAKFFDLEDGIELALKYAETREFPFQTKFLECPNAEQIVEKFMRIRLTKDNPEISPALLIGCFDLANGKDLLELYLSTRLGLLSKRKEHGSYAPSRELIPFWRCLCNILIKRGLNRDALLQFLNSTEISSDYWHEVYNIGDVWYRKEHLFKQISLVDEICGDRPFLKDTALTLFKLFGFSYPLQLAIMRKPWGEEVMSLYIKNNGTLYFADNGYDDNMEKDTTGDEHTKFMKAFKSMPHASELMEEYLQKTDRGLHDFVVLQFLDMENADKLVAIYINRFTDKYPYGLGWETIKTIAETTQSNTVIKQWIAANRHLSGTDGRFLLNRPDAEELLLLFLEKQDLRSNNIISWNELVRYPKVAALALKKEGKRKGYLSEDILRYLRNYPNLAETDPEFYQVIDSYIRQSISDDNFRLSYNASTLIVEVNNGAYLPSYISKDRDLNEEAVLKICDRPDAEELLTRYFRNRKVSFSENIVRKISKKGWTNLLELYLYQIS